MKVYLYDKRPTPEGWVRCYWPDEVILHLLSGKVEALSLDHDLGDTDAAFAEGRKERTGYDVMEWLERVVIEYGFKPVPALHFHTDNPVGKQKMMAAKESIRRHLGLD